MALNSGEYWGLAVINTNGEPLTQERVEAVAAELGIPRAEARRMLAKKKLRGSS